MGTNFESTLVKTICQRLGISKLRCTVAHPQTDGQTERFNRTLCDSLTHYVSANQRDWDRWVGVCVSAFRFSRHSTTGYSPFELVYGQDPRVPVLSEVVDDVDTLTCGTYREYVHGLERRLTVDRANALRALEIRQERSTVPNTSDIQVGDKVMLKVQAVKRGTAKKLANRFSGPYVVVKVQRPDYVIRRGRKRKFVHGSNLKKVDASVCDDLVAAATGAVGDAVVGAAVSLSDMCCADDAVRVAAEQAALLDEQDDVDGAAADVVVETDVSSDDEVVAVRQPSPRVTRYGRQSRPPRPYSP